MIKILPAISFTVMVVAFGFFGAAETLRESAGPFIVAMFAGSAAFGAIWFDMRRESRRARGSYR